MPHSQIHTINSIQNAHFPTTRAHGWTNGRTDGRTKPLKEKEKELQQFTFISQRKSWMTLAEIRSLRVGASSIAANSRRSAAFISIDASLSRGRQVEASIADAPEAALEVVATSLVADARFVALVDVRATFPVAIQLVAAGALTQETTVAEGLGG